MKLKEEMDRAAVLFPALSPQEQLQLAFDLCNLPIDEKKMQFQKLFEELEKTGI